MLTLIKLITKVISILNSEVSQRQIAAGFAWGAVIGLTPIGSLFPYVLLFLAFIVNINLATMFLAAAAFKILSFIVDPLANAIGYFFLVKLSALKPLWTSFYNMPVVPLTNFNNTLVMGSFIVGLILLVPLYLIGQKLIISYRTGLRERMLRWKITQVLKASALYRFYETYQRVKGG